MFTRFLRDFYPRPPRGGRPHDVVFVGECNFISIHALREEGDQDTETGEIYKGDFYPRPPRGGRRDSETNGSKTIKFLSTPSARRATKIWGMGNIIIAISIHALREEGDSACPALVGSAQEFLSTPSARRATKPRRRERSRQNISIHALREEGDRHTPNSEHGLDDFYPRPPRGGRPLPS